jgi:hypothetical protein
MNEGGGWSICTCHAEAPTICGHEKISGYISDRSLAGKEIDAI